MNKKILALGRMKAGTQNKLEAAYADYLEGSLQGQEPEAYDEDVLADQIETRLNVNGLKRLLNEQSKKQYGIR